MMNAKEARKMVERAIENEIVKFKENAIQFCEELSTEIETCANKKYCNIVITVPNNIKKNYVVEILEENGYSVNVKSDGKLDIRW